MPVVELRGITKRFPGVVANHDVHLRVERGHVHAIVGENGAGKSTLMKVLYGMLRPDQGDVLVDGAKLVMASPADAIAAGIGMVHQHFMLADNLTVLENVVLGAEPRRGLGLDFAAARARIAEISGAYGLGVQPDRLVGDLSVGERQRVEILKVLYRGARVLILDEPTAVLVPQEVSALFRSLRELTAGGRTVLFISHKLDEVLAVADRITVMRRGTAVATVTPQETSARRLAELMVGSELPAPVRREAGTIGRAVLRVDGLTVRAPGGRALLDGVSLEVREGEVLGIAGVEGNGQSELVEAIVGIRPVDAGTVWLDGEDVTRWSTRRRREAGVAYVPADRQRQGLLLEAPLWENCALGHQTMPPFARGPWIDRRRSRERAAQVVRDYGVRAPSIDVTASSLSGGNQQKLVVGREVGSGPRVLVAAHPTRGVDVGAQAAIWEQLRRAREEGLAVLLVSADLDELIGMSDTIKVILRGRIVATVDPRTVTPEELGAAMTGAGGAGT